MSRRMVILIGLLVIPTLTSSAFALPETAITRTHLMKDVEPSSITTGIGIEFELIEDPAYMGDSFFGYLGYAPLDWLEFGIGTHAVSLGLLPSIDAKIDLVDIFSDASRFSCLLMGGFGGLPADLFFFQAGIAMNLRVNKSLQLYLGAGSDSVSTALNLQLGTFVTLLRSLGISANAKLVIGQEGTVPIFSIAPLIILYLKRSGARQVKEPRLEAAHFR